MGLAVPTASPTVSGETAFSAAASSLRALTAADLAEADDEILHSLRSSVALIPEVAGHLVNSGGKRLRPMLTLAAARLCGYAGREHVKLAAAVELIHGATLLHDDVVDDSNVRRGTATANVIWGNKESVLVGDFIFSRAFELMVAAGDLKVLHILSAASAVIAQGEVLQLATQKNLDATFDMYLNVVRAKTAALFAAATHAGAAIAGTRSAIEASLRSYGENLGIAYQLVDDALDYAGFDARLGKRTGDDFREGKMTLPIVYALGRADPDELRFWRRTIGEGVFKPDDFARARAILDRTRAVEQTLDCARSFALRAIGDLAGAPDTPFTRALAGLAEASPERTA